MIVPMASINPLVSRCAGKRRTNRIGMSLTVSVYGQDGKGQTFTVGAKATSLNHHGGALVMTTQLPIGATVTVRNSQKAEATMRIVSHSKSNLGMNSYGAQFVDDAAGFWGIHFPNTR